MPPIQVESPASPPSNIDSPANAPNSPDALVELRDGSVVRGWIAERRVDGSLVLVLPSREVHTVAANLIVQLTDPRSPIPIARPVAPAVDPSALATTIATPDRVPLRVESVSEPQQVGISGGQYTETVGRTIITTDVRDPLCMTPCTLWVRPGPFSLWAGGEGIVSTHDGVVVTSRGLRVRVRRGLSVARDLGRMLMWMSIASFGVGMIVTAIGTSTRDAALPAGIALIVGGNAGIAGGVTMQYANGPGIVAHESLRHSTDARARAAEFGWNGFALPFALGARF